MSDFSGCSVDCMGVVSITGSFSSGGAGWKWSAECAVGSLAMENFLGVMEASNSNFFSSSEPNLYEDVPALAERATFNGLAVFSFNGMRFGSFMHSSSGIDVVEGADVPKPKPEMAAELVVSEEGRFSARIVLTFVRVSNWNGAELVDLDPNANANFENGFVSGVKAVFDPVSCCSVRAILSSLIGEHGSWVGGDGMCGMSEGIDSCFLPSRTDSCGVGADEELPESMPLLVVLLIGGNLVKMFGLGKKDSWKGSSVLRLL
jgi:hypothetical protein